uniref:AB hydrolase-1 domain-containing protein n=1 Tax=Malurus cyaneus samueli TaxID=2593467 RepID=A0A8C5U944_9PASS
MLHLGFPAFFGWIIQNPRWGIQHQDGIPGIFGVEHIPSWMGERGTNSLEWNSDIFWDENIQNPWMGDERGNPLSWNWNSEGESFTLEQKFQHFLAQKHPKISNTPGQSANPAQFRPFFPGFRTCVLTDSWVDDSAGRSGSAALLQRLRRHFDLVLESRRLGMHKPDPRVYGRALREMGATAQEAIFLDDLGENLKPARDLGMATILVRDPDSALRQLQELSGVQLLGVEEPLPEPCDPSQVTHGYVTIRIPALADAGFRVIALEMKGYGESTAPPDIPEYSQEQICKVRGNFLGIGIPQVILVGHDWGGAVAWNVALFYPERNIAASPNPGNIPIPGISRHSKNEIPISWEYPGIPAISQHPQFQEYLSVPKLQEYPGVPKFWEYLGIPDSENVPAFPNPGNIPALLNSGNISVFPQFPGISRCSRIPGVSQHPQFREYPGVPEFREYPGIPHPPRP